MTNQRISRLVGVDASGKCHSTTVNGSSNGCKNIMARSMNLQPMNPGRRNAKMIGLFVVFAASIIIVSGIALSFMNKDKTSREPETPAEILIPGTPYNILGFTYDSGGAKLPSCNVKITDLDTGNFKEVVSDPTFAAYLVDLTSFSPDWNYGDDIQIVAEKGVWTGQNQSVVAGGKLWLNVTLDVLIPEFPTLIVPIAGMIVFIAAVSLTSRRDGKAA